MTSDGNKDLFIKIAYFSSLAGASLLFGFSATLTKLRKNQPENTEAALFEEGAALARKALMRGTIYSICGFGAFSIASYHLFGKQMIRDFNAKAKRSDEKDIEYLKGIFGVSKEQLTGETVKTESSINEITTDPTISSNVR